PGIRPDHSTCHRHSRRRLHHARRDPDRGHGARHALRGPVQGHAVPGPSPSPAHRQPEGDDMTASGATAAADEGLVTAVRGETAGAQAAIVIVSREPAARETLRRELSKRYGADYQILACSRPTELKPWMRDLRTAGLPVALVIGGVG